jgi:hypothetical protein
MFKIEIDLPINSLNYLEQQLRQKMLEEIQLQINKV